MSIHEQNPIRKLLIAPSILAADFSRLGEEIVAVEAAGADWVHLDVMDGHFVPNLSMGPGLVKALRPHSNLFFDVHLMLEPVDPFLEAFAESGADRITIHIEAGAHAHRSLQRIRALGVKAGIAICPATPAEHVADVLDMIDYILVMTVNPGFGGQKFIHTQTRKIRTLRDMVIASGHDIRIGVDGGIDPETAPLAVAAGADVLIAGTSIYSHPDYAQAIREIRSAEHAFSAAPDADQGGMTPSRTGAAN